MPEKTTAEWFAPFAGHRMFTTRQGHFAVFVSSDYGNVPASAIKGWKNKGWVKLISSHREAWMTITTWRVTGGPDE
jgi:hypothetical protein